MQQQQYREQQLPNNIDPVTAAIEDKNQALIQIIKGKNILKPFNWDNNLGWTYGQLVKLSIFGQFQIGHTIYGYPMYLRLPVNDYRAYPELTQLLIPESVMQCLPKEGWKLVNTALFPMILPSNINGPPHWHQIIEHEIKQSRKVTPSTKYISPFYSLKLGLSLNGDLWIGDMTRWKGIESKSKFDVNMYKKLNQMVNKELNLIRGSDSLNFSYFRAQQAYIVKQQEEQKKQEAAATHLNQATLDTLLQYDSLESGSINVSNNNQSPNVEVASNNNMVSRNVPKRTRNTIVSSQISTNIAGMNDLELHDNNDGKRRFSGVVSSSDMISEDDDNVDVDNGATNNDGNNFNLFTVVLTGLESRQTRGWLTKDFTSHMAVDGKTQEATRRGLNAGHRMKTFLSDQGVFMSMRSKKVANNGFVVSREPDQVSGMLVNEICKSDGSSYSKIPLPSTVVEHQMKSSKDSRTVPDSYAWDSKWEAGGWQNEQEKQREFKVSQYGDEVAVCHLVFKKWFTDLKLDNFQHYLTHAWIDGDDHNWHKEKEYETKFASQVRYLKPLSRKLSNKAHVQLFLVFGYFLFANGENLLNMYNFDKQPSIVIDFAIRNLFVQAAGGYELANKERDIAQVKQLVADVREKLSQFNLYKCMNK